MFKEDPDGISYYLHLLFRKKLNYSECSHIVVDISSISKIREFLDNYFEDLPKSSYYIFFKDNSITNQTDHSQELFSHNFFDKVS